MSQSADKPSRRRVPVSLSPGEHEALRALAAERPGPRKGNRRLSLRYLVQTGEAPPVFRLDVNDRSLMTRDYGFWLENRLRQRFDLDGVPLVIEVRTRT